jgi:hypothetical protein
VLKILGEFRAPSVSSANHEHAKGALVGEGVGVAEGVMLGEGVLEGV